jgi:hypothetical protein
MKHATRPLHHAATCLAAAGVLLLLPGSALGASRPFTYFESFESPLENTSADPRDINHNGIIDCGTDNDCSTITSCVDSPTLCDEWTLPLPSEPNLQFVNESRAANSVNFKSLSGPLFQDARGKAMVVDAGSTNICPSDQDNGIPALGIFPDRMDWHIHTVKTPDIDDQDTAHPGSLPKAFRGQNSVHWGRHVELLPSTPRQHRNPKRVRVFGDTYCLQCMNAFVLDRQGGLNLNHRSTREQPLQLSFWHTAEFCDSDCYPGFDPGTADELGIVEVRSAPIGSDSFGVWERATPTLNPYDGVQDTAYATPTYEPTDDVNPDPPAGVDPATTMCSPLTVFIAQGRAKATATEPANGEAGVGVWVPTTFNLSRYANRHIQVRFITTTLDGQNLFVSYLETSSGPFNAPGESFDDGWYIDDIRVSGLVE